MSSSLVHLLPLVYPILTCGSVFRIRILIHKGADNGDPDPHHSILLLENRLFLAGLNIFFYTPKLNFQIYPCHKIVAEFLEGNKLEDYFQSGHAALLYARAIEF